MMQKESSSSGPRLAGIRPKGTHVGADALVSAGLLAHGGTRVRLLEAARRELDAREWAVASRAVLAAHLRDTGAVLLRGFLPMSDEGFHAFVADILGPPLEYRERSSPRTRVAGHIYTSTEYPPHQSIFLHNENAYADVWPLKIAFYCALASETGGGTPLADVRAVFRELTPALRERFADVGVRYVRHFTDRVGLSWREVFQADDPRAVEAYCAAHGYDCDWLPGTDGEPAGVLRTCRRGQAIATHPVTREPVWFNHAAFFHLSTLGPDVRDGLLAQFGEDRLPNQTFYGNGRPLEPDVMETIRSAYRAHTLSWSWRAGDVLLLDNMLVAHGRESFTGPRRILVGMAERYDYRQLCADAEGVTRADG
jgi:alpha-ketoglutarate-dependent taurine dioxygenase